MRKQHKSLIKRKRGQYKDEQEGGLTFMIVTPPLCWNCMWSKGTERGKGMKRRIRVRYRRVIQQLTDKIKSQTEMMRETVGGRRRMM